MWGEIWFLDIKVVPQETLVRDWYSGYQNTSERSPLLNPNSSATTTSSREGHFYTPMDSPDHSDEENQVNCKNLSISPFLSSNMPIKLSQDKVCDE